MKPIRIVADESVDFNIVRMLRANGYDVFSVAESTTSLSDKEVLDLSLKTNHCF